MEDEIIFLYVFSILLDEDICLGSLRNSFDTNNDVHLAPPISNPSVSLK